MPEKGVRVILTSRDIKKGEAAKSKILKAYPEGKIRVMDLDLMDLSSIRSFVSRIKETYDRLDVLMNNAGIMMTPYFKTKDGFEVQMGTNHLGHFALTGLLLELIKNTPGSRVVNVSSSGHRFGTMDQARGALSRIRASVDATAVGGQYYGPHRNMTGYPVVVQSNEASHSQEDAQRLWEMSEELTRISFEF